MDNIETLGKFLEPISIDKAMDILLKELMQFNPETQTFRPQAQSYSIEFVVSAMKYAKDKAVHG